jgi:3'-5' exoribonuclease
MNVFDQRTETSSFVNKRRILGLRICTAPPPFHAMENEIRRMVRLRTAGGPLSANSRSCSAPDHHLKSPSLPQSFERKDCLVSTASVSSRRFINTLADGDSIEEIYLLSDKQLRSNRNAALYLLVELRDKSGAISARMWNVTEEQAAHVNPGDFVAVRGKVQLYQGALQMIISQIQAVPTERLDPADFVKQSERDLGQLTIRLRELVQSIDEPALRTLIDCFLIDEALMTAFTTAPAGMKAHHAYRGGLLEHVVNMLEIAQRISDLLPAVDRNLLLAGIFLHDIGKTRELAFEAGYSYTDEGQLLGHLSIGVEMLSQKIAEVEKLTGEPFPKELTLRLKHLILSHHGTYEFGSPKLPMTPEAIALHHIDNLDAKVHEFCRDIADDPNQQASFTPFNARLDRKLFKGIREGK